MSPWKVSTVEVWYRHPGYLGAFAIDVYLAAGFGITSLVWERSAFSGASFAIVRATGGITVWGVAMLALAGVWLIATAGRAYAMAVALTAGAALYLLLALWLVLTQQSTLTVSPWGAIVFSGLGLWCMTQANEYRRTAVEVAAAEAAVRAPGGPVDLAARYRATRDRP